MSMEGEQMEVKVAPDPALDHARIGELAGRMYSLECNVRDHEKALGTVGDHQAIHAGELLAQSGRLRSLELAIESIEARLLRRQAAAQAAAFAGEERVVERLRGGLVLMSREECWEQPAHGDGLVLRSRRDVWCSQAPKTPDDKPF